MRTKYIKQVYSIAEHINCPSLTPNIILKICLPQELGQKTGFRTLETNCRQVAESVQVSTYNTITRPAWQGQTMRIKVNNKQSYYVKREYIVEIWRIRIRV